MTSMGLNAIKDIPGVIPTAITKLPAGVYFLCLGDEIVYVGQSIYPTCRIHNHVYEGKKTFDSVYLLPVKQSNERILELNNLESAFIRYLQPKFNGYGVKNKYYGAPKMTEDIFDIFERYECKQLLAEIYKKRDEEIEELRVAYLQGWMKRRGL